MTQNASAVTLLTLSGLNFTAEQRIALFVLTLLWYLMILFGNFTIICVIFRNKSLHEPMYIFLCNLCANALYGTVGFYPKFLSDLMSPHVISYSGCMLQGYIIHSSTCGDFSFLTLMAYDRYVAICRPLTYHSVMTKDRVYTLVFFSWFVPLFCMFMNTATLLNRKLCGSHIQRVYCINWNVASLACAPSKAHVAIGYFNMLFYFGHFLFVLWSYMYLIKTCMMSRESFQKFTQTCLPHLICLVVYCFSVLLDLLYMRLGSVTLSRDLYNFMAIEFLLIPPVVNPLIYGLKLSKIRSKLVKCFYRKRSVNNKSP